jgi:hypothetical protein
MVVGQSDVHHGSDHHLAAGKSIKRIRMWQPRVRQQDDGRRSERCTSWVGSPPGGRKTHLKDIIIIHHGSDHQLATVKSNLKDNNYTPWVGSPPSGRKKHLKDKKLYIIGRLTTWQQKKALKDIYSMGRITTWRQKKHLQDKKLYWYITGMITT